MVAAERHKREMRLIVPGEKADVEIVNDYAKIYYVPARRSAFFDKRYRIIMPWQYMTHDSVVRKILLAEMPDMVEITDKYTLSLFGPMVRRHQFSRFGRPMLVHFSCERMDDNVASFLSKSRLGRRLSRALIGYYSMPSFDFHIANSPYTAEEFYESVKSEFNPSRSNSILNKSWRFFRSPRIPIEERIFVCPRGVNAEQYSPDRKSVEIRNKLAERAGIPNDSVMLLYAGRISPEKNIGLLGELMEILSKDTKIDFRLVVAGDGPQVDWLRNLAIKKLPGNISLLGHLDKETLANYYANVDVFIHPNPKEPFGIAPLEAMASGVPTVVPNAGGLLFYATDENTWPVAPTAEAFAGAINEVVADSELRERKIKKALVTVTENTRVKSTDFLIETYDKMYEDFQKRRDLFVDEDAAASFDFSQYAE